MTTFGDDQSQPNADQGTQDQSDSFGGLTKEEIESRLRRDEHGQKHIKDLESEASVMRDTIAELQSKLTEAKTIDSLFERMDQQQNKSTTSGEPTASAVDVDKLLSQTDERVEALLTQRERQQREERNFTKAFNDLQATYGEKVNERVQQRARDLGLDVAEMDRLAKNAPDALVELIRGPQQARNPNQPTLSSVNGIPQNGEDELEKFAKLRRENPKEYHKPETQAAYRRAILEKAKKDGSQFGNPI